MPSIYQLKPAFQNLLRPLVVGMAKAGLTANQVTLGAFVLSALGEWPLRIGPPKRGRFSASPRSYSSAWL